jgi:uncharacterized membrane protein YfcA
MHEWWLAYLALGAFVGFFNGLLGIGGGSLMVPILALIFAANQFAPSSVVHLALGTAMATLIFTSVSSAITHHRHKAVKWTLVGKIAPGVLIGTFSGAMIAGYLNLRVLSLLFTILIYILATRMLIDTKPGTHKELSGTGMLSLVAAGIGLVSSLTATGGAALVVAYLVKRQTSIHNAIGTAAAIGWPLAVAGTLGYFLSGLSVPDLPPYSLGYIYLPAGAVIVAASIIMAPVGAKLSHKTPARTLRKIFAVLLYILATKMLLTFF